MSLSFPCSACVGSLWQLLQAETCIGERCKTCLETVSPLCCLWDLCWKVHGTYYLEGEGPRSSRQSLPLLSSLACRRHSVPLILCNYDGFYDGLIKFFKSCDTNGTLAAPELKDIILADSNEEVGWSQTRLPVLQIFESLLRFGKYLHSPPA